MTATSLVSVLGIHCSVTYHFCIWGVPIVEGFQMGGLLLPMVLKGVPFLQKMVLKRVFLYGFEKGGYTVFVDFFD